MQYQSKSSSRCRYSCSSSPPCPCLYSYCQPHRNSKPSHYSHYPHTTVHHHYHYLPHSSTSSPPPQTQDCQQCCHNIPTCTSFSPTKNNHHCKSSSSSVSSNHNTPISLAFTNYHHQQREYLDPKKYKLLTHSIQELIQSERDYVDDLYIMVEICLAVLHQQKWASARHVAIMSRNSSEILAFHQRVLASLNMSSHQPIESKCHIISQTFLDHRLEFMTHYVDYCDGHSKAWKICTEYRSKSEWSDFILQCQSLIQEHQKNKSLSPTLANKRIRFEDFLIKPIQRICRYQLLLKEVIRYANSSSTSASSSPLVSSSITPPYQSRLTEAFNCMHHIATEIDQQNEKKEYQERTYRFIQRLESDWRLSWHGVAQLGPLVVSGALDIQYVTNTGDASHTILTDYSPHPHETAPPSPINTANMSSNSNTVKSRYLGCFVFSSYIIIVQVKKQSLYEAKHWFPLHIIELIDQDNDNEFMLQCHQHIFICTASCLREKQNWIEKIRSAQQSGNRQQQQQQDPVGLVSSLSNHPFTSTRFASPPLLRSNTAFFSDDRHTYQYHARRSHTNDPLPMSSSSPSLLLAAVNEPGYHAKIKKNRSLSTHLTLSTSPNRNANPSASSPSSPIFQANTTTDKQQPPPPRRHSSLDLFSMATHNLNRVSLHFKAHHRNAIRDAVDQRIRDVCTPDYLSSRARHLALDRKSSTTRPHPSPLVVAAATTSPVHSLSPSPSPSTPVPTTTTITTSSRVSSSSLLGSTSMPFHHRVPSPTLYPPSATPLPIHPSTSSFTPCRPQRSNPKNPLMVSSSHRNNMNTKSDRETSSTTMDETVAAATTKKDRHPHRRVSRLLQSLWHRLSRTNKKKRTMTSTKTEIISSPPHFSTVSLPTTTTPIKIQKNIQDNRHSKQQPSSSAPITIQSDFISIYKPFN